MLKPRKEFKNYTQHLKRYLLLSLAVFILALLVNTFFIIFEDIRGDLIDRVSVFVHYLAVFIAVMMLGMGIFYYRSLNTIEKK